MTDPLTGAVYGNRYRVVEAVGSGGMATVYRGTDVVLNRDVAIKVMHPHLAARADARARFSREAQAIARLHHPNVVDVYDFSQGDDDTAYLVTEFVQGITLSEFLLRHGPFWPQPAALIGHAIADALAHAHKAGIVHRDIKPDNLMISREGTIKLMDFGIATAMDLEQMTATGAILGSPAHMAPEQIEGGPVDARVDVFAFGTLLYAMVAGRLPFMASNPHALFRLILEGQYDPPSRHNPAVGRRFEEIVATCLARAPADRWSSMGALQDALALFLKDYKMIDVPVLLQRLLTAPEQFQAEQRPGLVRALCAEGRREARSGSLALAIDAYNRAMAVDPEAIEPRNGLTDLTSRSRRKRRTRALAIAALGAVIATGAGVALRNGIIEQGRPIALRPAKPADGLPVPQLSSPSTARFAAFERESEAAIAAAEQGKLEAARRAERERLTALIDAAKAAEDKDREQAEAARALVDRGNARPRPPRPERPSVALMPANRGAGPGVVSPPDPKEGLMEVVLGSLPPNARIFLDGNEVSAAGYARMALVSGRRYTLRCVPPLDICASCPPEEVRPFNVPDVPPKDGIFAVKCDFRKYYEASK